MPKRILFLYYNKPTDESFDNIIKSLEGDQEIEVIKGSLLREFGLRMDLIDYRRVSQFIKSFPALDGLVVGDIFWGTGQNICSWCVENGVKCFFLQHGQWIYTGNKQDAVYCPTAIYLLGNKVRDVASQWPLSKCTKLVVTGSPRYDGAMADRSNGGYVYFAPPVVEEQSHSGAVKRNPKVVTWLSELKGLDKHCQLVIHPHYREADIEIYTQVFPQAQIVAKEANAIFLIKQCDRLLTHRLSTMVLDGLACKKRIILINFGEYDGISYYNRGYFGDMAIETSSANEVLNLARIPFLENDLPDDVYCEQCKPYIWLGNASQRVITEIKSELFGNV